MLKQTLHWLALTVLGLGILMATADDALAQDLEPRRWSHLPRGQWLTLSGGYSYDGELFLNGQSLDYTERSSFLSLGWGMALTRQQSIHVAYVRADTQVVLGSSSDNLLLSWSLAWSR
jgi:hypothetical protein